MRCYLLLLSTAVLEEVNKKRKGCNYASADDAILLYSTSNKKDLKDDPSLRFFKIGIERDGYWTNSHAKLQM